MTVSKLRELFVNLNRLFLHLHEKDVRLWVDLRRSGKALLLWAASRVCTNVRKEAAGASVEIQDVFQSRSNEARA